MKEFKSIDDILDFAINNEQNAVDFYVDLAKDAKNDDMRKIFEEYAREEISHKARLMKIKEEGIFEVSSEKVADLKLSDYLVRVQTASDMSYEDALILAMKREKSAFKLYMKLAEKAPNEKLQKLFTSLAHDEAKHKLRFELEYDEYVLREN